MTGQLQTLLSDTGRIFDLKIEFPESMPVRISGFKHGQSRSVLISSEMPDSELIFAILQKIGLVAAQKQAFPMPWYLNRSYENELAGEIAYKTRRTVRHAFNSDWRARTWALLMYVHLPCAAEFIKFLRGHPEERKLVPLAWYGIQKSPMPGASRASAIIILAMFTSTFFPDKTS